MRLKAVKLIIGGMLAVLIGMTSFGSEAQEDTEQAVEKPAATEKPTASRAEKGGKKRTDIDFEDELIEGELKKPELFYLLQKKQFNFKRLIKLRDDFLPEMRRDGDEVRRGRGKN